MLRTVQVESGTLRGLVAHDPRVTEFRGVPYAKPPVGELRWRAPQPVEPWEGVRECYHYGPMPMMKVHPGLDQEFYTKELHPTSGEYEMSEDCLYLNIFSPAQRADEKLPVFCYIHGGGLQDGYNYEIEFDGERLARRGVIVVMIGYRLGLFGFFAHPQLTAATPEGEVVSNFGMQDQSFALHWVKRNIAAFGGDPTRITICGQSAGAASVQAQLCSPMNEAGLIAGAICQSSVSMGFADSPEFGRYLPLSKAEEQGVDFFQKAGIRDLAEAKALPAEELMGRVSAISAPGSMFGYSFGTCIDGRFITEPLAATYYNDRLPNVPMMVGVCAGECRRGGMMAGKAPTYAQFLAAAEAYGPWKQALLEATGVKNDADVAALYAGDDFNGFIAGTTGFCELRSAIGRKVYYYVFDHDIPGDDAGSFHGSDLWFMFDSLAKSWRPFEGKHFDLARQVASYWVNFVKGGDPNGQGVDYIGKPLPRWRPYTPQDRCVMTFRDVPEPGARPESKVMEVRLEASKAVYQDKK